MENNWKVEAGIPIPKAQGHHQVFGFLYSMKAGESVLLSSQVGNKAALRSSITYAQQRYGKRFTTRKTAEGVRLWRTE